MRVFITGAAGYIGRAVTTELVSHGHTVLGLCRNSTSADILTSLGAQPVQGDIEDLPSLSHAITKNDIDAVVHLAFTMDFSDFPRACAIDRAAIQTMAEALRGTGKPLVVTSGTLVLPDGEGVDEGTEPDTEGFLAVRAQSEDLIVRLCGEMGIRGCVVRLAPVVHGEGDKGFVRMLGDVGRRNGVVAWLDSGVEARWPAAQLNDAAVLFRLVLEKGRRPGAVYHGVAEEGVQVRDLMEAIGKAVGLPAEGRSREDIEALLGFFAGIVGRDHFVSSERTKEVLGWRPEREGLLKDVGENYLW